MEAIISKFFNREQKYLNRINLIIFRNIFRWKKFNSFHRDYSDFRVFFATEVEIIINAKITSLAKFGLILMARRQDR